MAKSYSRSEIAIKIVEIMLTVGGLAGAVFILLENEMNQIIYSIDYGIFLTSTFILYIILLSRYKPKNGVMKFSKFIVIIISTASFILVFSSPSINKFLNANQSNSSSPFYAISIFYGILAIIMFLVLMFKIMDGTE